VYIPLFMLRGVHLIEVANTAKEKTFIVIVAIFSLLFWSSGCCILSRDTQDMQ